MANIIILNEDNLVTTHVCYILSRTICRGNNRINMADTTWSLVLQCFPVAGYSMIAHVGKIKPFKILRLTTL